MTTQSQGHIDALLTDEAISFFSVADRFIIDSIVPRVPVDLASNRFPVFSRHDFARDDAQALAPGARAPILDFNLSTLPYSCVNYGAAAKIVWKERDAWDDPQAYERGKLEQIVAACRIRRERIGLATLFTSGNWNSTNRLVGVASGPTGLQFLSFAQTGSDPMAVVDRAHDLVEEGTNGKRANKLVVSPDVHRALRNHAAVRNLIQYGGMPANPAQITEKALAALFNVEQYQVARAVYSASNEGAASPTYTRMVSGQMVLMYSPDGQTKYTPSACKQFSWSEYDDAKDGASPVFRWVEPSMKSDLIQLEIAPAFVITADSAAVHFATCLA